MPNKPLVVFRADGHAKMGLGHLIRSSALAEMLSPAFHCVLVYRDCPPSLLPTLREGFSDFKSLDPDLSRVAASDPGSKADAVELVSFAKSLALELKHGYVEVQENWEPIIVLDGYHFQTEYQRVIKDAGFKLVCIDDIHDAYFAADLVINHSGSAVESDYEAAEHTRFLLGFRYVLLRKPFQELAKFNSGSTSDEANLEHLASVFICFGGADPDGLTIKIVTELLLNHQFKLHVVLGAANRSGDEIDQLAQMNEEYLTVYRGQSATQMATIMRRCGRAITPPSSVALEYLCAGGKLYLYPFADNQAELYHYCTNNSLALSYEVFPNGEVDRDKVSTIFDGEAGVRFINEFTNLQ